jgi:hypothetical protein
MSALVLFSLFCSLAQICRGLVRSRIARSRSPVFLLRSQTIMKRRRLRLGRLSAHSVVQTGGARFPTLANYPAALDTKGGLEFAS